MRMARIMSAVTNGLAGRPELLPPRRSGLAVSLRMAVAVSVVQSTPMTGFLPVPGTGRYVTDSRPVTMEMPGPPPLDS